MRRPADVCVVMGWRAFRHGHLLRKADSSWRDMQAMPLSINGLPHPGRKASTKYIDTASASGLALVRLSGLQPRLAARRWHAHETCATDMSMRHAADRWQPSLASHRSPSRAGDRAARMRPPLETLHPARSPWHVAPLVVTLVRAVRQDHS
ncbi:hypothetical protein Xmar_15360 [Xanthomonas axonopodis pv. martyniicola]|nr:hypothetical protein Xmar_15360 [Xanthomonas axonopodis pv. martyniicola]OOW95290.1 hypothetical protein Xvtr_09465 [Xanthomonas campestris pv. vitiscarnosae]